MARKFHAWKTSQIDIDSASSATAVPTDYIEVGQHDMIRCFCDYTGTVTSATLRIWFRDHGVWYRGDEVTLDPANGDEARDWYVGENADIAFQVTAIAGGGSITVRVRVV